MAAHAPAPQRAGRLDMAEDREARCRMAPQTQNPSSLAARTLRRQTPKVGAVCGKAACTDLCGGTGVTRFPTAIMLLPVLFPHARFVLAFEIHQRAFRQIALRHLGKFVENRYTM